MRDQLVALGVDPDRIVRAAYGEDGPTYGAPHKVVVWGTRAGLDAVIARTLRRGHAVMWTGLMTPIDRAPQPGTGVVAGR